MEMQPQVGSSGKVGKKRLNNDLVGNLWAVLQSGQIFTLSKMILHLFIVLSVSDLEGICGCCLLSSGGFGGLQLGELILRKL